MKTKRHFFGRRFKSRSEKPKRTQTSPSRSEDEEYSVEQRENDKEPSKVQECNADATGQEVRKPVPRKESVKLDEIAETWKSFSSNGSDETTASDMMKCLNALRIQDVSATNSTPTPSAASIPRLAPPPLTSKDSVHSAASERTDSWPNLQRNSHDSAVKKHESHSCDSRRRPSAMQKSVTWVAFASEDGADAKPDSSLWQGSLSLHAVSSVLDPSSAPLHGSKKSIPDCHSVTSEMDKSVTHDHESHSVENNSTAVVVEEDSETFPAAETTAWETFGDNCVSRPAVQLPSTLQASDHPCTMETVKEDSTSLPPSPSEMPCRAMRPAPPKPPIMPPPPRSESESTHGDNEPAPTGDSITKALPINPWVDSDEDAVPLSVDYVQHQDNPFASMSLQKRYGSACSVASKSGDAAFQAVLMKYGTPSLELVETVNASFSGNALTRYSVWGEVKFKVSGAAAMADKDQGAHLSAGAFEALDLYHLVLRLKCVLHHVYLKHVIAKKGLMDDRQQRPTRQSSLTMNEARRGLVESKVMHWSLARCYQEALSNPVTLMRYPVHPNTMSGPPLKVLIQWQRPKKAGQPVMVDVAVIPNRRLSTSLWGVTVCLKGFETGTSSNFEAMASPEAKWNSVERTFEWSIPIINPDDAIRHLRVKVTEKSELAAPDSAEHNFSANVKFVMPHTTLSGTLLLGWIEHKNADAAKSTSVDEEEDASQIGTSDVDLIFCEKMCLSGNYGADINY